MFNNCAQITCTRGEVATLVRRILSVSPGDGQAWFAVTHCVKTAAMRAMLPKDVLERFLDGPFFSMKNFEIMCPAYVGEKLAGQDANGGAQHMDIGQIDKSEGEDEDVNAVQQRGPHDRSNQKHEQVRQRAKTFQPSDCQLVTISATSIDSTRQETWE